MKKEKTRIYNKLSKLKLVAMLLVIGLFSGCTTSLDATTLIKPPKLTADQSELGFLPTTAIFWHHKGLFNKTNM